MNSSTDGACFCSKAELELFSTPPVNVSMERGDFAIHRTLASLTDTSPLEFFVPGSPEEYVDLGRTRLYVKLKIVKLDGSNPDAAAKLSTANLLLHSLFTQVDCKLNQKLVSPSVNTYPYKAYLETLLAHGRESKTTWLESEMYHQDGPPSDSHDPTAGGANPGLVARRNRIKVGKTVELVGRPHVDIFQQDKYLLNGVDMSLKFIRSPSLFHLISDDASGFKAVIMDAALYVRKVKINPSISLEHHKTLDQGITAKYPLRRGVVTTFTVPAGNLSFNKENLITGQLPRRVIIGFVTNEAFNGTSKTNPFEFKNLDLSYLTLSTDSQQFPSQPLTPNYEASEATHAFYQLYSGLGLVNSNSGLNIDLASFQEGHTLYPIDLTADQAEGSHVDPIKYGNLRMEAHFRIPLVKPINCICYAEYDNMLQIDKARNIVTDFASS